MLQEHCRRVLDADVAYFSSRQRSAIERLDQIPLIQDARLRVLDIGCGSGYWIDCISRCTSGSATVVCLDIDRTVLHRLRDLDSSAFVQILPVQVDAGSGLPFRPSSFDFAIVSYLGRSVPLPVVVSSAVRCLRPHGSLLLVDWLEVLDGFQPSAIPVLYANSLSVVFRTDRTCGMLVACGHNTAPAPTEAGARTVKPTGAW